ncbi:MAG: sulfatase-like hydrolase/transferase [Prevotella sp.]|nr:sulfatase-like hydrolase/transferase [Prevotella sp.]
MRQRLLYLVKFYLVTVLLFVVAKIAFMLINHEGHDFTATDVWQVVRHGLSLDLSTSLYLLIIPFLVAMVAIWADGKWTKITLRVYSIFIATMMMLAFVADTSLYPFWGFKLDASCLQYLESPTEAGASVSGLYLTVRFVVLLIGIWLVYRLYKCIPLWSNRPRYRRISTLGGVLLIPLIVIGIRGGLDESTTNIGQVYYSQDQFLNHAAVNPVFSFLASYEKTASDNTNYDYYQAEECNKLLAGLYPTESIIGDTLLNTQRPNVVVILLESCGEIFHEVMPNFNQLKREGIWFSNCYGNSFRTDRGTVCALSGYPSFPTTSVMKIPKKAGTLPSIAKTLQKEGYATSYLYGGDINFTNMRSYLIATGWEKLHWKADYTSEEQRSAEWGVRDDITFKTLFDQICASDTTRHFLMGYSTLSSHEPWDVPIQKYDDKEKNAFSYLDDCIGKFVSQLKATPYWRDLLIVMIPDHGVNYKDIDETRQVRNHIPMLWVGGAVKAPKEIKTICNQTDLPATLLGQMGFPHGEFTFSRDVTSQNYTKPLAFHSFTNGFSIVDSTGFTVVDLNIDQVIVDQSKDSQHHMQLGKAILQVTAKDLKER